MAPATSRWSNEFHSMRLSATVPHLTANAGFQRSCPVITRYWEAYSDQRVHAYPAWWPQLVWWVNWWHPADLRWRQRSFHAQTYFVEMHSHNTSYTAAYIVFKRQPTKWPSWNDRLHRKTFVSLIYRITQNKAPGVSYPQWVHRNGRVHLEETGKDYHAAACNFYTQNFGKSQQK